MSGCPRISMDNALERTKPWCEITVSRFPNTIPAPLSSDAVCSKGYCGLTSRTRSKVAWTPPPTP